MTKSTKLPSQDESSVVTLEASNTDKLNAVPVAQETTIATRPAAKPMMSMAAIALLQATPEVVASKFIACRPGSAIIEAMEANGMQGERFALSDLPFAKVPAGAAPAKWIIESVVGADMVDAIEGVLVYYGKAGVLWPTDIQKDGTKPLLRTDDLIEATQVSDDFGDLDQIAIEECFLRMEGTRKIYDWNKLPYNQWGSGKNGGKRCKEQRLVCILRPNDYAPVFVRIPPTSVNEITSFMKKLTLQAQKPHYECVVSLSLEKKLSADGTVYHIVNVASKGMLSENEGKVFKALYTDMLGSAMKDAVEVLT